MHIKHLKDIVVHSFLSDHVNRGSSCFMSCHTDCKKKYTERWLGQYDNLLD